MNDRFNAFMAVIGCLWLVTAIVLVAVLLIG
jgi:hypothetical protein